MLIPPAEFFHYPNDGGRVLLYDLHQLFMGFRCYV